MRGLGPFISPLSPFSAFVLILLESASLRLGQPNKQGRCCLSLGVDPVIECLVGLKFLFHIVNLLPCLHLRLEVLLLAFLFVLYFFILVVLPEPVLVPVLGLVLLAYLYQVFF